MTGSASNTGICTGIAHVHLGKHLQDFKAIKGGEQSFVVEGKKSGFGRFLVLQKHYDDGPTSMKTANGEVHTSGAS